MSRPKDSYTTKFHPGYTVGNWIIAERMKYKKSIHIVWKAKCMVCNYAITGTMQSLENNPRCPHCYVKALVGTVVGTWKYTRVTRLENTRSNSRYKLVCTKCRSSKRATGIVAVHITMCRCQMYPEPPHMSLSELAKELKRSKESVRLLLIKFKKRYPRVTPTLKNIKKRLPALRRKEHELPHEVMEGVRIYIKACKEGNKKLINKYRICSTIYGKWRQRKKQEENYAN